VPFKANAKCRHHIPKQKRRLTNWPAYEAREGGCSRKDHRRTTEVGVSVLVLNRMLELGRPDSVRVG
jgi:hypothetical protein